MHHRIMVRRERESKSEIAGFGGFNLPFPAISNRLESEKETPAQSLRTLFTDDRLPQGLVEHGELEQDQRALRCGEGRHARGVDAANFEQKKGGFSAALFITAC